MYSNTSDLSGSSDTGVQVTATTYCSCATERLLLDAQQHLVASWKPFWAPTRQRPQANLKATQSLTNQEKVTLIRTVRQFKYSKCGL